MAKITFYKDEHGRIIQETKQYGKVERIYVTEEQMDKYETSRNAFAGLGCLVTFIVLFYFYVSAQW